MKPPMTEHEEEVLGDLEDALKPTQTALDNLETAECVETGEELRLSLDEAIDALTEALKEAKALRARLKTKKAEAANG